MHTKLKAMNLELLFNAVLRLENLDECYRFFDDLCTIQELKAMGQRIQVAAMLGEKKVYSDIVAKTGASTATISRVNRALNYGSEGYKLVFKRMRKDELL